MTQSPPNLATLQQWLQAVITHQGGIAAGIASAEAQQQIPLDPAEITSVVLPSRSLSSEQRLAVYGNAYFARLLECMREMFPALRDALEEQLFDQFAIGYLTTHPPHSYTLEQLSDRFIAFLQEARANLADPPDSWPDFVIDLARLEFHIERVFDGPGIEQSGSLSAADLEQIDPDNWPRAMLHAAPCLRLLAFRFPVNDYYTAWRESASPGSDSPNRASPPLPQPRESHLALMRRNYVVRRYPLSRAEYELLSGLLAGLPVGEAIEAAAESADDLDRFAFDLAGWFQSWTAAGFFLSVNLP